MTAHSSTAETEHTVVPVELKGRMLMISVLRAASLDASLLDAALAERFAAAPDLMQDMPVVLDLEPVQPMTLAQAMVVVEHIRRNGYKLIGLRQFPGLPVALTDATGLPEIVLSSRESGSVSAPPHGSAVPKEAVRVESMGAPEQETIHSATRLVTEHVRSGQQIYARGGDLIVLGTVSAGAEILADGHIHVYGSLRGRALAGVRGMNDATIFCRRLDAELLAVAGNYRIAEDIQEKERGENRLVTLSGQRLLIREV